MFNKHSSCEIAFTLARQTARKSLKSHIEGTRSSKLLNKVIKISTCELLLLPYDEKKGTSFMRLCFVKAKQRAHESGAERERNGVEERGPGENITTANGSFEGFEKV